MAAKNKGLHEEYAQFFEMPTREGLRDLLRRNYGETNQLDFKQEWPDFPKLARHILAMANSEGGILVAGIAEKDDGSLDSVGLSAMLDKVDVSQGVEKFLPPQLEYQILNFPFDASEYPNIQGKKFQTLIVEDKPEYIPFVSRSEGTGIRRAAIYVRRSTSSEEASYEELQNIFNRRLETGYSSKSELDLEEELAELKVLYSHIRKYRERNLDISRTLLAITMETNPHYPEEGFEDFVARMIDLKKERIETLLKANLSD